jgi:large subunit ribosomal protein L21
MYAVISLNNQQFKVEKGQVFLSQKTENPVGSEFEAKVLLTSNQNKVNIGSPTVSNSKVLIKVLEDVRSEKIRGFKYKRRKNYHRSWGHRQDLQKLEVVDLNI